MYNDWYMLSNSISTLLSPTFTHRQLFGDRAMGSTNKVLVLGATGGIGGELARQLKDRGWDVRALQRRGELKVEKRNGITWFRGDALNAQDVMTAAQGCSVIVHAVNPPGYRRWSELVLPMVDNSIAAATTLGATLVLPGTIYNFGPDAFPVLSEDSPQHPVTRKGAIRVEMERRLFAASKNGARALIVRAGDFFGAQGGNNWFSQGLAKPGKTVRTVSNPGRKGVGHQWSYLPDVARTMVELLARRDSLETFAVFHMAGHWDADGSQMCESIQRVVARRTGRTPRISAFPWWIVSLASPFVTTFREMRELRYLWGESIRMDNSRLIAVLGKEPHTPLDEAVEATLIGQGSIATTGIPSGARPSARSH
jgi:nucleoside-diphosphate-sugar epimerase